MYGDARFGFLVFFYGLMDPVPVHSLSSVFGQQGGVNIDDFIRKCFDEVGGNLPKKAGKYN